MGTSHRKAPRLDSGLGPSHHRVIRTTVFSYTNMINSTFKLMSFIYWVAPYAEQLQFTKNWVFFQPYADL